MYKQKYKEGQQIHKDIYICTSAGISKNIGTHRLIKRLLTASAYQMPRYFATWICCEQMD